MALPKVTYGNYNYGQYASPTAIRYKGGLGEGLAQGAIQFAKGIAKGKQKLKAAEEQAYMVSEKYQKELRERLGNASAQNRQFITSLKENVGNIVKQYKLGRISLDEYSSKMDGYNNILFEAQGIRGLIENISNSKNPEVSLEDVRFGPDNFTSNMVRSGLLKENFILSAGEKGDSLILSLPTKNPKDFQIKNISAKNLLSDSRLYTPQTKFTFDATPIANSLLSNIKNSKQGNEAITYKRRSIGGKVFEYGKIKSENIDPYLADNLNKDLILGALSKEQKAAYFEDSIKEKVMGEYTGSEEQDQEIYNALSNEIKNKLINLEFDRKDITATVNKQSKDKINLESAENDYKSYTSDINGLKNYFIDKKLEFGDEIKDGAKPGSIVITKKFKDENDKDVSESYEIDFTNKETWRFIVGQQMKNDLRKFYGGSQGITEQLGQFNIDQAYDNFMKQIKNTTVKFNPKTGEIEEKNNVEKALEMDVPFLQQLKMIPGIRAGR